MSNGPWALAYNIPRNRKGEVQQKAEVAALEVDFGALVAVGLQVDSSVVTVVVGPPDYVQRTITLSAIPGGTFLVDFPTDEAKLGIFTNLFTGRFQGGLAGSAIALPVTP